MTYYLVASPRNPSIGYSGSYTMPGKAIYLQGHVYDTLREIIMYIYRDYKTPQQYNQAQQSYQKQIDALQTSVKSASTQVSQANSARVNAESRVRSLEVTLVGEKQKNEALTQQNGLLTAAQETLRLQAGQAARERASALDRAEKADGTLQITLKAKAHDAVTIAHLEEKIKELEERAERVAKEHLLRLQQAEAAFKEKRRQYKEEKKQFFALLTQSQSTVTSLSQTLAAQGMSFNSAESAEDS